MAAGSGDHTKRPDRILRGQRASTAARTRRQRRLTAMALIAAAIAAFFVGLNRGAGSGDTVGEERVLEGSDEQSLELPRGGTVLLPAYRLVGFYGAPQDPGLGALGIGAPAEASRRLARQARPYRGNAPLQPFFELIATVAQADPGPDGLYRFQQPHRVIREYLRQARADRNLLVLDVQPGRADFSDEVDRLAPYLRQPDVGLGLDPEWSVGPGEAPGQVIGSVTAAKVNQIASRLSKIVRVSDLPQKLLVVHQFTEGMITSPGRLKKFPGVAMVLNVDGFGTAAAKKAKYRDLQTGPRSKFFSGFKLFYEEDTGLMSPDAVLGLKPGPKLVVYE